MGTIARGAEMASCLTYTDPWKSNDNTVVLLADIDLDAEANAHPEQELEGAEQIRPILFPLDNLYESLKKYLAENKLLLDSSVWMFALGMQMAKQVHLPH